MRIKTVNALFRILHQLDLIVRTQFNVTFRYGFEMYGCNVRRAYQSTDEVRQKTGKQK